MAVDAMQMSGKKTRTKASADKNLSLGSQQIRSRPISSLFFFVLGVLFLFAIMDYESGQSTQVVSDVSSKNIIGKFGAESAFLIYHWMGIAGWFVPIFMFCVSYSLAFKKPIAVLSFRTLMLPCVLLSSTGLAAIMEGIIWSNGGTGLPGIFTAGFGGQLGSMVFGALLRDTIGAFGSSVLLFAVQIAALTVLISDDVSKSFDEFKETLANLLNGFKQRWSEAKVNKAQDKAEVATSVVVEKTPQAAIEKEAVKEVVEVDDDEPGLLKNPLLDKNKSVPVKVAKAVAEPEVVDKPKRTAKKKVAVVEEAVEPEPVLESAPEPAVEKVAPVAERVAEVEQKEPKEDKLKGLKIVEGERVEKADAIFKEREGDYIFPPLDLLPEAPASEQAVEDFEATAMALQKTLADFKIKVELGEVHRGPVITRYDIYPSAGVKVEKISGLDKNIAMALKAEAVRILAPVPGKGCVGVEVPNAKASAVCIREIVESKAWADADAHIPLVLGKEVSGKPLVVDLAKMPHLLIAGSTGAGKTVCINSIIASLCYFGSPDDIRFIMVDPKIVEMQIYNTLPHMLIPVVTDAKKVPGALKWLISEMDRRYHIFAKLGVRNIAGFNAKVLKTKEEKAKAAALDELLTPEERANLSNIDTESVDEEDLDIPKTKLPYIVCIVDEFADLMMVAPADIETCIARLAQLARAAGIHLILATQRPAVNVITGTIKANLPCRIAFKVASYRDSMTILDTKGAEALIGKGDMLCTLPGSAVITRAQGAFMGDDEIEAVVEFLKVNGPPDYVQAVQESIDAEEEEDEDDMFGGGGDDNGATGDQKLLRKALQVLKVQKKASTSLLQRKLSIGYNRAARMMDLLEDKGIVGPDNGSKPRELLIDPEDL